jgi:hypothetical protein
MKFPPRVYILLLQILRSIDSGSLKGFPIDAAIDQVCSDYLCVFFFFFFRSIDSGSLKGFPKTVDACYWFRGCPLILENPGSKPTCAQNTLFIYIHTHTLLFLYRKPNLHLQDFHCLFVVTKI